MTACARAVLLAPLYLASLHRSARYLVDSFLPMVSPAVAQYVVVCASKQAVGFNSRRGQPEVRGSKSVVQSPWFKGRPGGLGRLKPRPVPAQFRDANAPKPTWPVFCLCLYLCSLFSVS